MSDVRQVKVDNWGIYFLQRLKHFFNRTDYCDLTLQFQDNAQLKVHRLVLSACTEYFELLERTCEMYEDCLVMPDDLQADVVVPIVNFMYTGHLEFKIDLLERLYQTSQILNMPVLSKLLESHRNIPKAPVQSYGSGKRAPVVSTPSKVVKPSFSSSTNKRSYSKAFENTNDMYANKKVYQPTKSQNSTRKSYHSSTAPVMTRAPTPEPARVESPPPITRNPLGDARPTRYELPEELDTDNVFDNSFCNISYTCKPLMVHPETVKRYSSRHAGMFSGASGSKKLVPGVSTLDIVDCKRIIKEDKDNIFNDDGIAECSLNNDLHSHLYPSSYVEPPKDSNQLFDQILDDGPKVTIETKDSKAGSNLDHAKIISEVLKKYPHLVKSNKNIKLKILNTPNKTKKSLKQHSPTYTQEKPTNVKTEEPDCAYESDVIDSQHAAQLIALGAENTKGPWICLICGTPGKALHFTSYYNFRRHLVQIHNEKPVSNICEHCGLRSPKRNYMLHHLYSQHNIRPPAQFHFPKCDTCNYIALTDGNLVKHKMTHKKLKNFRCNVCTEPFVTTKELLAHIQTTGHKYSAEKRTNLQCIYCLRTFLRHGNLYAHLKTHHEIEAKRDGILDDSDDEKEKEVVKIENRDKTPHIKYEPSTSFEMYNENLYEETDVQYEIQEGKDGAIQLTPKKQNNKISYQQNVISNTPKQKILNPGFGTPKHIQKPKAVIKSTPETPSFLEDTMVPSPSMSNTNEEIVIIDNVEYIMRDNQLIPKKSKSGGNEYILTNMMAHASLQAIEPTSSMEYSDVHNANIIRDAEPMVIKKTNTNQPIQIVVSNEEEYKALMASNHPLLFNNGDANKTLAVLAAPHNASLETSAIDLDNTQSNDMMVIQEDYPMNVTETVSTDNSNIVVVYSHPIEDQNKQYQILTTGGIGSQYVQSSAIITQNYETVTTSASVMSSHMLQPQPATTWQNNVQSGNAASLLIGSQRGHDMEIKSLPNAPTHDFKELPEIHLTPTLQTIAPHNTLSIGANVICSEHISQTDQEIVQVSEITPEAQIITEAQIEPITLEQNTFQQETSPTELMTDQRHISHNNEHISEQVCNNLNLDNNIEQMEIENVVEQTEIQNTEPILNESVAEQIVTEYIEPIQNGSEVEQIKTHDMQGPTPTENVVEEIHDIQDQHTLQNGSIVKDTAAYNIEVTMPDENIEQSVTEESVVESTHDSQEPTQNENVVVQTEVTESSSQEGQDEQVPALNEDAVAVNTIITNELSEVDELRNTLDDEHPPQSQAYDEIVEINRIIVNDQQSTPKSDEKLQNLKSDWSDDEYDVVEDAPQPSNVQSNVEVTKTGELEILEETIENIQQEVLSHVSNMTKEVVSINPEPEDVSDNDSDTPEENDAKPQDQVPEVTKMVDAPVANDPEAQEKISSLLNDWEDNDSQEEDNSAEPPVKNENEDQVTDKIIPKPDIRSLVSDWDEEDEEK